MSAITVIYDDVENDCIATMVYGPKDRETILESWEKSDDILEGLQDHPVFKGLTCWNELSPIHFRILIARNFDIAAKLPAHDRAQSDHPVVNSLSFLVLCYANAIEKAADCYVEYMRITRIGAMNSQFLFTSFTPHGFASLSPMPYVDERPKKPTFRMIVDNDRDG